MPNVDITIPDVAQSVSRPIVFDVIRQIQEITKIDTNARIYYPDEMDRIAQAGSTIDDRSRESVMGSNKYLFIEVQEDFDRESISTTAVNMREHIPVFTDKGIEVSVTPVYATSNVTINFKYRTPSKTEAERWRDDIRMRLSHMRDINLHDLRYHYLLPIPVIALLKSFHELREKTDGYGENFKEWMLSNATPRLTVISDLVDKQERLAISETQTRVEGLYDFDSILEKPSRESDTATYTIAFSYKFSYERPIAVGVKYPIIIHNELLPEEFFVFNTKAPDPSKKRLQFSNSFKSLNFFEQQTINKDRLIPNQPFFLPEHDEFEPMQVQPKTGTIFYALCVFQDDLKELLNLNELGDLIIDPDILEFIQKSEYPYICKPYRSVIQLNLFRGRWLSGDWAIQCDNNLNVTLDRDANRRIQHRIRMSLVTDISLLDVGALDRLRAYPKAFTKIITAINEAMNGFPGLSAMAKRSFVNKADFQRIYEFMRWANTRGVSKMQGPSVDDLFAQIPQAVKENARRNALTMKTVQVSNVIAKRK